MKTPYFIISKKKVLEQYNTLKELGDELSYSSKTNQDVTKILEQETDCFFSVHLANELKHIKDQKRTIFLAQGWNEEFIHELVQKGIERFVVDNIVDLETLKSYMKKNDTKVHIMLRLKLKENTIRTEKYYVFGMPSEIISNQIKEMRNDETVNSKMASLGIHFHRKTQNMSEWNLQYELSETFDEETLKNIDVVNIGGGFPSEYANTNMQVFQSIKNKLTELKSWLNLKNIKLMLEPGRFIAAPAVKLVTEIISKHEQTLILNASVYSGDMDALIVPVKLIIEDEVAKKDAKSEQIQTYTVKGITPCSLDIFRYKVYLPKREVGDIIIFKNAGAYNFATDFCDLEKIPVEMVDDFE